MSTTTVPTTGAGLEGVVAGESEICYIDGYAGILSYRGYNIHTLAEHATFEEVIWLLWKGTLPKQANWPAEGRSVRECGDPRQVAIS
jgi:citrate synthase